MPLKHGSKVKSSRSKQHSENSENSDRISEFETNKLNSTSNNENSQEFFKDTNEYQKQIYQNTPVPMTNPLLMQEGYQNIIPQSAYPPKNNLNITTTQAYHASHTNVHSKPRVVIKEPVPYYKMPNPANIISSPVPAADYGREITETLRVGIEQ